MHDKIMQMLKELERKEDCKILFAAESGSRAWGFASPDSDYDIRVIYVKPEAWYWDITEKKADTFAAMLPDDTNRHAVPAIISTVSISLIPITDSFFALSAMSAITG